MAKTLAEGRKPGSGRPKSLNKLFYPERPGAKGMVGYDSGTEVLDPHPIVKAVSAQEMTMGGTSGAGYMRTDAAGVITGGHAGGGAVNYSLVSTSAAGTFGIASGAYTSLFATSGAASVDYSLVSTSSAGTFGLVSSAYTTLFATSGAAMDYSLVSTSAAGTFGLLSSAYTSLLATSGAGTTPMERVGANVQSTVHTDSFSGANIWLSGAAKADTWQGADDTSTFTYIKGYSAPGTLEDWRIQWSDTFMTFASTTGIGIVAWDMSFKIKDNYRVMFGTGNDYSMGFDSNTSTFRIVDGSNITTNEVLVFSGANLGVGTEIPATQLHVSGGAVTMSDIAGQTAVANAGALFSSGGALWYRGSGGTLTNLANA